MKEMSYKKGLSRRNRFPIRFVYARLVLALEPLVSQWGLCCLFEQLVFDLLYRLILSHASHSVYEHACGVTLQTCSGRRFLKRRVPSPSPEYRPHLILVAQVSDQCYLSDCGRMDHHGTHLRKGS